MKQSFYIFDKEYVEEHLSPKDCIELMTDTFIKENAGVIRQPLRTGHPLQPKGLIAFMPGYSLEGYFGAKILSVFSGNNRDGYPSHQGQVLLFEAEHGVLQAMADATAVTKIRTGAASAAASRALANPDSSILAVLGTGEQAESHILALQEVFDLTEIRVCNRLQQKAEAFCAAMQPLVKKARLIPCCDPAAACENADIICTVTASATPVISYEMLKPGCHINAVGSCSAAKQEIDSETVKNSRFFTDSTVSLFSEAGDFLIPLQERIITKDHCLGTIGQVLCSQIEGRISHEDITVFESLGIASEDLVCARFLYQQCTKG